ncbi:DUF4440 domain-containing protein [Flavobacterium sp. RSB2_4_14]|uniref:DUF4440 domain-containing protein n=1 Tax=Flavobacterium sp. RSB2_4_14 TaxID=3447665 RepID=UPI003F3E33A3
MNKFYSTILLLFITNIAFSQVSNNTHKMEITNLVQESFDELWAKFNAEKIEQFYTKDFLLLENGEIWNNDSIVNYIEKAKLKTPKPNRINKIEVIDIKIKDKTAWIAYQNYATISVDNKIIRKAHWLESATAILTENGWKLDMLHSTRVKNE